MNFNSIGTYLEKAVIDSRIMTIGIENLGKRIYDLRSARWRSQQKFIDYLQEAFGMSIHQTTLSAFERGEKFPSAENLALLARALETSTDYLLGLTDDDKPVSDLEDQVVFTAHTEQDKRLLHTIGRGFLGLNNADKHFVLELVNRLNGRPPHIIE